MYKISENSAIFSQKNWLNGCQELTFMKNKLDFQIQRLKNARNVPFYAYSSISLEVMTIGLGSGMCLIMTSSNLKSFLEGEILVFRPKSLHEKYSVL